MKKIISIVATVALLAIAGIHFSFTTATPETHIATRSTVNLTATNSTSDGVYVVLENTTSGGSTTYFIPPNTPNGIILGQIPANSDIYTVKLTSTGGAHDMWVYWEHKSHVTGLIASGMALGCESCARITIFN